MSKQSVIHKFLLKFDFFKKMIFVIGVGIVTALLTLCLVIFSYQQFIQTNRQQQEGIKYQSRLMSVQNKVDYLRVQLNVLSNEELAKLKTQLIISQSFFSLFINEIRNHTLKTVGHEQKFYLEQLNIYDEKFHRIFSSMQENELNDPFNLETLRLVLNLLGDYISSFSQLLSDIFELQIYTNYPLGLGLDIFVNQLPDYNVTLSKLLSINTNLLSPQLQAEIQIAQTHLEHILYNVSFGNRYTVFPLEHHSNSVYGKDLELFLTSATHLSNSLSTKLHEPDHLKDSWKDLYKVGIDSLNQSQQLYSTLAHTLHQSLANDIHFYRRLQVISSFLLLLGILLVLTPYITKAFRNPLNELKQAAEKLAAGDLSTRIPIIQTDEVGAVCQSFNETAKVYEHIMLEADRFANDLLKYSSGIYSTSKMLEQSLYLQEITVQDIVQNSKQILNTAEDFPVNLMKVNHAIELTARQIGLSRENLNNLQNIIQLMVSSAHNTVIALSSIKNEVDKTGTVINTLIIIADQINLLSLNTAIRANKTGLKKIGFSVIADKIKDLADQTAYATLDMEEIVKDIHEVVPKIVCDIDQFNHEIQEALKDSLAVREHFQKLLTIKQNQIASFKSIDQGMQDQAEKTYAIHKAITELIQSTEKTTRSIRSLYVEVKYLHHSTNNLQKMTKKFTKSSKIAS